MPKEKSLGKPATRRYGPEEEPSAVRVVPTLRSKLRTDRGTVQRVADQLGYGVESVRKWVAQADIDEGLSPGTTTADAGKIQALEQRSGN